MRCEHRHQSLKPDLAMGGAVDEFSVTVVVPLKEPVLMECGYAYFLLLTSIRTSAPSRMVSHSDNRKVAIPSRNNGRLKACAMLEETVSLGQFS